METPRINELIAQVVVWHNRHRLARRITAEHVRAIGVVVLPFVVPDTTGKTTVNEPDPRVQRGLHSTADAETGVFLCSETWQPRTTRCGVLVAAGGARRRRP